MERTNKRQRKHECFMVTGQMCMLSFSESNFWINICIFAESMALFRSDNVKQQCKKTPKTWATFSLGGSVVMNMTSLTAHKFFQGDTKDTPGCQGGRIRTHSSAWLLEQAVSEPLAQPLQTAVTQEPAGVQIPKGEKDSTNVWKQLFLTVPLLYQCYTFLCFSGWTHFTEKKKIKQEERAKQTHLLVSGVWHNMFSGYEVMRL